MALIKYVTDSNADNVIDSSGASVIISGTDVSIVGDVALSILPDSNYKAQNFSYTPDAVFSQSLIYNTLTTNTTRGKERRRNKWDVPKRMFKLRFINATTSTSDGIAAFFNSKQNHKSFSWTNPFDSTVYKVRFDERSLRRDYIQNGMYNIELTLVEVL